MSGVGQQRGRAEHRQARRVRGASQKVRGETINSVVQCTANYMKWRDVPLMFRLGASSEEVANLSNTEVRAMCVASCK